ncbi:MAG: AMP-binding protein [Deltaproteobacteria bacterium]|nr:AMP-binding protein [Deltaproteobacteria bacterium]
MSTQNGVLPVMEAISRNGDKPALIFPDRKPVTFGQLEIQAVKYRKKLRQLGLQKSDTILLGEAPSPELYAIVLAALAMGVAVAVIEPWMPIAEIESVARGLNPKLFLTGLLGRFWGFRVPAIRSIPIWSSTSKLLSSCPDLQPGDSLEVTDLPDHHLGLVAFTSGTTGLPKGVPRRHGYLRHQHRVLKSALHHESHEGPELTIFTNFVFANLASCRASVVIPSTWKANDLKWASSLSEKLLAPETATVGPAFLRRLSVESGFERLNSIHVGGALTDVSIFEAAFGRFRDAEFLHVYGSSEAEPVATMGAKEAVELSRESGYFQTLALGRPISEINSKLELSTTWVSGDHVCPLYIGAPENIENENRLNKRVDADGTVWHAMGDRVRLRAGVWWYLGRSSQSETDFIREQELAFAIDSSKVFLNRSIEGRCEVYFEGLRERLVRVRAEVEKWKESVDIYHTTIVRDRRHRARIDRESSRKKSKLIVRI